MKKILLLLATVLTGVSAWAQTAPGGPEVTFTNVQQDGKEYVLYINDSNELALSAEGVSAESLGAAAKFRLTVQSNGKYTFYNEDKSLYMIWRGKGHGANSDKGVLAEYDSKYCDWELGDGSSSKPGTYYLKGKRSNESAGSIVVMNAGTFDAYGYSIGWDARFSNLFRIDGWQTVTYSYDIVYKGKSYGSQSATGVVGLSDYATPILPVGVAVTIPEGKVKLSDGGKTIELTCTDSNCPIEFAADAEGITKWYYLKMHANQPKYIQYIADGNYIEWTDASFNVDEVDSHVWGFVGNPFETKLINKSAKKGVVSTGDGEASIADNATSFVLAKSSVAGTDKFCLQNTKYLNAQRGKVKHWSANDAGSTFIPVEYVETEVEFIAGYATLYLGYQTYVPENVKAYVVSSTTTDKAMLQQVEGIIPANTGVVLEGTAESKCNFVNAIGTAATIETNLLAGTTTTTMVEGPAYVLANKDEKVGFYKAELNNENKFQNNANKAYIPVVASARFLSFDFGDETAIETVESSVESNAVVYDLAGRRVQGAQKGIFVVNGKKVIK